MLPKGIDSKKLKEGDTVMCQTVTPLRTSVGIIPSGSKVVGHVTVAKARSNGDSESTLGLAFDKIEYGKGKEAHVEGLDFDRSNLSVNQTRPGLFTGEWHNNHHLYPGSARAGFLRYQLDLAWIYIFCMYKLGAVSSYHDSKKDFLRKYGEAKAV